MPPGITALGLIERPPVHRPFLGKIPDCPGPEAELVNPIRRQPGVGLLFASAVFTEADAVFAVFYVCADRQVRQPVVVLVAIEVTHNHASTIRLSEGVDNKRLERSVSALSVLPNDHLEIAVVPGGRVQDYRGPSQAPAARALPTADAPHVCHLVHVVGVLDLPPLFGGNGRGRGVDPGLVRILVTQFNLAVTSRRLASPSDRSGGSSPPRRGARRSTPGKASLTT